VLDASLCAAVPCPGLASCSLSLTLPGGLQGASKVQVPILAEAHLVVALSVLDDFSVAVHVASSPVWTYVSPASYWHILDTLAGDLQLATSLPSQPCMA
jgi:hypothetical protein